MLYLYKLIDGTDLVASFVKEDDSFHYVDDPLVFAYNSLGNGYFGLSVFNWLNFCSTKSVPIRKDQIMFVTSDLNVSTIEYYSKYLETGNSNNPIENTDFDSSDSESFDSLLDAIEQSMNKTIH